MEKKKPSKEVNTQKQLDKKKAGFAAYKASGRRETNKRRRIAKESALQAYNLTQRPRRTYLRKLGAVARLQRRLDAATKVPERARLAHSLSKAVDSVDKAVA